MVSDHVFTELSHTIVEQLVISCYKWEGVVCGLLAYSSSANLYQVYMQIFSTTVELRDLYVRNEITIFSFENYLSDACYHGIVCFWLLHSVVF